MSFCNNIDKFVETFSSEYRQATMKDVLDNLMNYINNMHYISLEYKIFLTLIIIEKNINNNSV